MKQLTILISGGGSNLAAIIAAIKAGKISARITRIIADRDCAGKQHAFDANIPFRLIDRKLPKADFIHELSSAIAPKTDLIILAGFLSIMPAEIIQAFPQRIINLHPSLLPKFGGAGMYGLKVHQAVIDAGEQESGCTVHYVDTGIDTGKIIAQSKTTVQTNDTASDLQQRIAPLEHELLVNTIQQLLAKNYI
ncbi:phosphoribosylglycinamide formyltransferase [Suttonella ornithocola]|uniref:Phosphoribosylglycinamide formyltransferase n=1 Tax=Suttonella ornithocola TaxID=279832 RepID=A0A380N1I3_9GAMM|nr:phosphoribosylglycinamide formyltransferase [Suttonella ornithocola]SUO97617.1 Phosphoribosylglycinamide formyltransferase [Suttonella ornithocola]